MLWACEKGSSARRNVALEIQADIDLLAAARCTAAPYAFVVLFEIFDVSKPGLFDPSQRLALGEAIRPFDRRVGILRGY